MLLYFLPTKGRMQPLKHVGKQVNECTAFECCVCVDLNCHWRRFKSELS